MTGLITLTGTQAAFAPADTAALKAAVGTCSDGYDFNSATGRFNIICTGGCLGETPDGSCPLFAASNDATSNPYSVIGDWDVSRVTDMSFMFEISAFNSDLSKWNTGAVLSMAGMFAQSDFNGDLSKWNTGAVLSMDTMFYGSQFNGDISKWNTGAVTHMTSMFYNSQFNGDLSKWNTGAVTYMDNMFYGSGFKRTLCGGQWQYLPFNEFAGRLGCCPAGTFMSNPLLNPFSVANSCSQCPPGSFESAQNDETSCAICSAGKFSTVVGRTTECDVCPVGTRISDTTTATKHDEESDCISFCSLADKLSGCDDDELQKIKGFYSNRQSCQSTTD